MRFFLAWYFCISLSLPASGWNQVQFFCLPRIFYSLSSTPHPHPRCEEKESNDVRPGPPSGVVTPGQGLRTFFTRSEPNPLGPAAILTLARFPTS